MTDKLAADLEARLGDRFTDARASMPRHATLRFGQLDITKLRGIAVHHSAGPRDQTPAQIAAYHVGKSDPFAGIGYHFVVRRGHVYYVGDIATQRAHVAGRNDVLLGICVTGDYTQDTPHAEDTTALRDLVAGLDAQIGRALPVDGHGAYALAGHGTACPGALAPIARSVRAAAPPGTVPTVDYRKVVWAIEQGVRILEGEGRTVDAGYIRSTYLADAIKRRDGKA